MSDHRLIETFQRARRDPSLAVLEGFHALKHALRFGATIVQACTADPDRLAMLAAALAPDLAERLAAQVRPVAPACFARLAPQPIETGVISLARRPQLDPAQVLAGTDHTPVVLLERPTQLGNLGAVVRVAAAGGAAAVLTIGPQDPWHPAALRGAAGLHFALPVARLPSWPPTDRPLLALDPAGAPLRPGTLPANAVLAFGSERGGLGPELLARAERRIALPMRPGVSSLNLATAVAVTLYTWRLATDEPEQSK